MYHVIPDKDMDDSGNVDDLSETASMSSFDMCELDEGTSEHGTDDARPWAEQAAKNTSAEYEDDGSLELRDEQARDLVITGKTAEAESDTTQEALLGMRAAEHTLMTSDENLLAHAASPFSQTASEALPSVDTESVDVLRSDADNIVSFQPGGDIVSRTTESMGDASLAEGSQPKQAHDACFSEEPDTVALAIKARDDQDACDPAGDVPLTTATEDDTVEHIDLLPDFSSTTESALGREQAAAGSASEERKLAEDLIRLAHAVSQREGVRQAVREEMEASSDLKSSLQSLFGGSVRAQGMPVPLQPLSGDAAAPSGPHLSAHSPSLEGVGTSQAQPLQSPALAHPVEPAPSMPVADAVNCEPARDEIPAQDAADSASLSSASFKDAESAVDAAAIGAFAADETGFVDEDLRQAYSSQHERPRGARHSEDVPPIIRKVNQGLRCAWRGARSAIRRAKEHLDGLHEGRQNYREREGYHEAFSGGAPGGGSSMREQCLDPSNVILTTAVVAAAGLLVHSVMRSSRSSQE